MPFRQGEWRGLLLAYSLILGFAVVHLVYWTDGRMRAPIMPAVAVLVAVGLSRPKTVPISDGNG